MTTPSGRFYPHKRICLSVSNCKHHAVITSYNFLCIQSGFEFPCDFAVAVHPES
uniref:Uncharacterized protein n=1 Tax=Triticum urartu TaxID=4572 RepID=A0A8R7TWL4_TRIUA